MYIETINISDISFCHSKGLWRDELKEGICIKANSILLEFQERNDSFVELRATPANATEFLILMELFWNVFNVKLSPITNSKYVPVGFTAVRGCEKPNDLEGYYKFCKNPPPPVKVEYPKTQLKPIKKSPIESERVSPALDLTDAELRNRFGEITVNSPSLKEGVDLGISAMHRMETRTAAKQCGMDLYSTQCRKMTLTLQKIF